MEVGDERSDEDGAAGSGQVGAALRADMPERMWERGPDGQIIRRRPSPSDPLAVLFQAGVFISEIEPDFDHTHVHFGATAGFNWQLETSLALGTNAAWKAVGDPIIGDDLFHEVEHDEPVEGNRFYRVRGFVAP